MVDGSVIHFLATLFVETYIHTSSKTYVVFLFKILCTRIVQDMVQGQV